MQQLLHILKLCVKTIHPGGLLSDVAGSLLNLRLQFVSQLPFEFPLLARQRSHFIADRRYLLGGVAQCCQLVLHLLSGLPENGRLVVYGNILTQKNGVDVLQGTDDARLKQVERPRIPRQGAPHYLLHKLQSIVVKTGTAGIQLPGLKVTLQCRFDFGVQS